MGNYSIHVVGESFKNDDGQDRQEIIANCVVGERVRLVREPENPYDEDAIAVHLNAGQIGYLDKKHASWISRILDEDRQIAANIEYINKGPGKPTGVVLAIRTGNDTDRIATNLNANRPAVSNNNPQVGGRMGWGLLLLLLLGILVLLAIFGPSSVQTSNLMKSYGLPASGKNGPSHWVTVDRLNRRTCPDATCEIVGQLFFREGAHILETRGGWGRISKYYPASCRDGTSPYIGRDNKKCTTQNGVFAEWVALEFLSEERPPAPAPLADNRLEKALALSDDYRVHGEIFSKISSQLIASGRCTLEDFEEGGGWLSSTNHNAGSVYFTYCGELRIANKIYLDVSTKQIFR